jgi:transcriptional regulator of arginine metabolism
MHFMSYYNLDGNARRKMTLEELILKIITTEVIQDQKTLLKHISQQGYEIDQSTLSRMFKKLKIQKHLGRYISSSSDSGLSIKDPNDSKIVAIPPNLIVIKTKSGFASAVSITLDGNPIDGVAGTIAGDDTIFVAILPNYPLDEVQKKIKNLLKY